MVTGTLMRSWARKYEPRVGPAREPTPTPPHSLGPRASAPGANRLGRHAAFHLQGRTPTPNGLTPAKSTLEHLHTPPAGADYARGWVVRPQPVPRGRQAGVRRGVRGPRPLASRPGGKTGSRGGRRSPHEDPSWSFRTSRRGGGPGDKTDHGQPISRIKPRRTPGEFASPRTVGPRAAPYRDGRFPAGRPPSWRLPAPWPGSPTRGPAERSRGPRGSFAAWRPDRPDRRGRRPNLAPSRPDTHRGRGRERPPQARPARTESLSWNASSSLHS